MSNILTGIDLKDTSDDKIILLLKCCGKYVPNENIATRNLLCQRIFNELNKIQKFSLEIYHTYIQICTENNVELDHLQFLQQMLSPATEQTYKLLMKNACENGDISKAITLLNTMKDKEISLGEEDFNSLVQAHSIVG